MARSRLAAPFFFFFIRYEGIPGTITASILATKNRPCQGSGYFVKGWNPYTAEGKKEVFRTINAALDSGINYLDTAPAYGNGHSESLLGEVLKTRRNDCYLASKVNWENATANSIIESCENSLKRLQCETIDVFQFHGGFFTHDEFEFIMNEPFQGMLKLKEAGKIRFIGITAEEAFSVVPLLQTDAFDMVQVCYNIIYQSAAWHVLDLAKEKNIGVSVMRPLTSGVFQRLVEYIQPEWQDKAIETCLNFVLGDSRVDMVNIGMRWEEEIKMNVDYLNAYNPSYDLAELPRLLKKIYDSDDAKNGL